MTTLLAAHADRACPVELRLAALWALAGTWPVGVGQGPPAVWIGAIDTALSDPDPLVRWMAVRAFAGDEAAAGLDLRGAALTQGLRDGGPAMARLLRVRVLFPAVQPRVVAVLTELTAPAPAAALAAAWATVPACHRAAAASDLADPADGLADVVELAVIIAAPADAAAADPAWTALIDGLAADPDPRRRRALARGLWACPAATSDQVAAILARLTDDPDPSVSDAAVGLRDQAP